MEGLKTHTTQFNQFIPKYTMKLFLFKYIMYYNTQDLTFISNTRNQVNQNVVLTLHSIYVHRKYFWKTDVYKNVNIYISETLTKYILNQKKQTQSYLHSNLTVYSCTFFFFLFFFSTKSKFETSLKLNLYCTKALLPSQRNIQQWQRYS